MKLINIFKSKERIEMHFQRQFCRKFVKDKNKLKEYWERYRFLNEIKSIYNINKDSQILDVGCGIASVLHLFNCYRTGIDPLADKYREIYNYEDMTILKAYGENIPCGNVFDVVFCSNVLDHCDNPKKVMSEMIRVVKNKGYIVLTVELFNREFKRNKAHPFTFTIESIKELISEFPLEIIFHKISPFVSLNKFYDGETKSKNMEGIFVMKVKK